MTHRFATTILPVLALSTALSGCSVSWGDEVSGVPLSELDLGGVTPVEITLAGPDEVIITEGKTFTVTLDGSDNASDAIKFDRDGDSLTIARDKDIWNGPGSAIIRITMPAPEELSIAGSGTIRAAAMMANAEIEIAGSGDIEVASIEADELSIDIFGSGDVKAAGTAKTLRIEIAGAGNVSLGELNADDARIEIAGSGNVELASDGKVDVEIAGSGNVNVIGDAECTLETAGSGSVTCEPAATSE